MFSAIQHVRNVFNGQTVNLSSIAFVFVLSCYYINQMMVLVKNTLMWSLENNQPLKYTHG